MKVYYHKNNKDHEIEVGNGYAWWVLLFGVFWFWYKGMIARGFFAWFIGAITLGIGSFIVPAYAFKWYEQHLIEKGYKVKNK